MKTIVIVCLLALTLAAPAADKMERVPGYPVDYNTSVYTGYLDTTSANRSIHYAFVESINGAGNTDPITLWLNGGPGCSSMLGFIQEIGPYYLEDGIDYKQGDNLTENKYSWHRSSNLLFFESPAGVGYSYNLDKDFVNNDATTAYDSLSALLSFFKKYPEYANRKFFIAGQSYAGKYIPDLAVLIDGYNYRKEGPPINLVSILVGNGVMTFSTLQKSTYEYMIDRKFVDPEIVPLYQSSCQFDPHSAGCRFFQIEFNKGIDELNPYNVYGYCYYNDSFEATADRPRKQFSSQESILNNLKRKHFSGRQSTSKYNAAPCAYFDGIYDYFNLNFIAWKTKFQKQPWRGPCPNDDFKYSVDPAGSIASYQYLLGLTDPRKIGITLYNGNWDAVVPYLDTVKGMKILNLRQSYTYNPWFVEDQHAGFQQLYSKINFVTFKGASHQVPQTKRAASFDLFDSIVKGHNLNTQPSWKRVQTQ